MAEPASRALRAALGEVPAEVAVAVGFSGGLDSSVLLHAAAARGFRFVRAVHVNHGISEQAELFEARCRDLAARLEVPLVVRSVRVAAGNVEANARAARYEAWEYTVWYNPGDDNNILDNFSAVTIPSKTPAETQAETRQRFFSDISEVIFFCSMITYIG